MARTEWAATRIDERELRLLQAAAAAEGVTVSDVLRRGLRRESARILGAEMERDELRAA